MEENGKLKQTLNNVKDKIQKILPKERIKTISIIILVFLLFCFAFSDDAQRNVELSKQVESLTNQVDELNLKLEDSNNKLDSTTKDLDGLKKANDALYSQKTKLEQEKESFEKEKQELTTKIEKLEQSSSTQSSSSSTLSYASSTSDTQSSTDNYSISSTYILNTNTRKFHVPGCSSVSRMSESNKKTYSGSRDDVISQGYSPCQKCNP